jgi:hypothetical protein
MTRERTLLLGAAVLVAAGCAAVPIASWAEASQQRPLSRLSNTGRTVAAAQTAFARQTGVHRVSLLAVRGGRAYYKLDANGNCFGSGPAADVGQLGSVDCPRGPFPTADRPVLDFSIYEVTDRGSRDFSVFRAEGFAADGISSVAFLRPNGKIAFTVAVHENVFATTGVPKGLIKGLAAFDGSGKEVWRSP